MTEKYLFLLKMFLHVCYNNIIFFGGVTVNYVALYRKYRPKSLDEVYGQKYIVEIIKNSVINNRFFHAYLFSGPRGTGKTTIAKLIAKIVNCSNLDGYNPCNECSSCQLFNSKSNPDIIEIDAASNNGVDEIRAIREKAVLMPSVSKYKVYIIDEVHMLSVSAFNALLKTLEEPPKHVIFILATTELDKVPETIISRCQCYDFKRIGVDDIVRCLENICEKENIVFDDKVLNLIATYCNGGLRDSIGLLDKLVSFSNKIDENLFYDVVGLVNDDVIENIYNSIVNKDIKGTFYSIEELVNYGKSVDLITEQMLLFLKNKSIATDSSLDSVLILVEGFSSINYELKFAVNPLLCFEIGVLKIINKLKNSKIISREIICENKSVNNEEEIKSDEVEVKVKKEEKSASDGFIEESRNNRNELNFVYKNFDIIINNAFALANKDLKKDIISKWQGFNDYVHNKEFSSIVSYFLDSNVEVVGEKDIILSANYSSIVENACQNLAKLELLFNLVMGKFYNLAFVLSDEWVELRNKYVSDIKSGKIYKYIEQNEENNDIIVEETSDLSDIVSVANDVFGNDIVEIK